MTPPLSAANNQIAKQCGLKQDQYVSLFVRAVALLMKVGDTQRFLKIRQSRKLDSRKRAAV